MTQSDVCTTGSRREIPPFEVTDIMRQRFEENLAEYLLAIAQMWISAGDDPESEEGIDALRMVERAMRVPERDEWMRPEHAIAALVTLDEFTASTANHLEGRDAIRTSWAFTPRQWSEEVARVMDITPARVRQVYSPPMDEDKSKRQKDLLRSKTALYRHYDRDGRLLYAGITVDLANREAMHSFQSPWWKHVDTSKVEWFSDRLSAIEAEAQAIKDEDPIFNIHHTRCSDVDRRRAKYLWAHRAESVKKRLNG